MYSCCSGICFLKPASTLSWLAKKIIATVIGGEHQQHQRAGSEHDFFGQALHSVHLDSVTAGGTDRHPCRQPARIRHRPSARSRQALASRHSQSCRCLSRMPRRKPNGRSTVPLAPTSTAPPSGSARPPIRLVLPWVSTLLQLRTEILRLVDISAQAVGHEAAVAPAEHAEHRTLVGKAELLPDSRRHQSNAGRCRARRRSPGCRTRRRSPRSDAGRPLRRAAGLPG